MKIKSRRVYYIRFTSEHGVLVERQFATRPQAVAWLNRAILDYSKYDAHLVAVDDTRSSQAFVPYKESI